MNKPKPIKRRKAVAFKTQKRTQIHDEYIEVRQKHVKITDIPNGSITPSMLKDMHMTVNARSAMPPKMTDDALIETAERYLKQCTPSEHAATYDQAIIHSIVPEMIKRLKEKRSV